MHFLPFRLDDYPYARDDLKSIKMDMAIARLGRNAIFKDGSIIFFASDVNGLKRIVVPMDEDGYRNCGITIQEKMCLRRICDLLEQADAKDGEVINKNCPSLFQAKRIIREFDQNFGGERFVFLCRDLIERNLGKSLYQYMAVDLIEAVYCSYNKNVNRDVDGFMQAIVDFIDDFAVTEAELRDILSVILSKSSLNLYLRFISKSLYSQREAPLVRETIIKMFKEDPYSYHFNNYADDIPSSVIMTFPHDDLVKFFSTVRSDYRLNVAELFSLLGPDASQDYIRAYRDNPHCDINVLVSAPSYIDEGGLESKKVDIRRFLSSRQKAENVIAYFSGLTEEEEKRYFIDECKKGQWYYLGNCLDGNARDIRRLNEDEFLACLPLFDMDNKAIKDAAFDYLRRIINNPYGDSSKVIKSLKGPEFRPFAEKILTSEFVSWENKLLIAERYGMMSALRMKRWD